MAGDLDGLLALLAEDITLWADGGGKVRAPRSSRCMARRRWRGSSSASCAASCRRNRRSAQPRSTGSRASSRIVSGRPLSALIFDIRGGRIQTIYAIGNPDKLQTLPASS